MQDQTSAAGWARRTVLALGAAAMSGASARAQQTAAPAQPVRPPYPYFAAPPEGEEPGFTPIFNGRTLEGWQGDARYWRVENGALVGEVTPEIILASNTFIIWQGGEPADFELKLDVRITTPGNSGVNYRSAVVFDPETPANRFAMKGYQLDLDGPNRLSGNAYEERGRQFLALRGQTVRLVDYQRKPVLLATHAEPDAVASLIPSDWRRLHIIARGPMVMHLINERLMNTVIDEDPVNRARSGRIGMQVHVGPPMKVEFRNIRLAVR